MLAITEDDGALIRGLISAHALKDARAVMETMGHHMGRRLRPWRHFAIAPDVFRFLYGHNHSSALRCAVLVYSHRHS